ncbi:MAG: hypothetical protein QM644_04285 [Mobilitalea sp.]
MKSLKYLKILFVMLLSISLTGCIQEYSVKEGREDSVAEYMANILLRSDYNYKQELILPEDDTEWIVTDGAVINNEEQDSHSADEEEPANSSQEDSSLTQVVGVNGFSVQYKSYKLVDSYPENAENADFSLSPRQGYQLLVATFSIKNTLKETENINLIKSGITYKLDVNTGTVYKPLLTLLKNDLQYIDLDIGSGKSKSVLLIFEVSKDADISNINLKAVKADKTVNIKLK